MTKYKARFFANLISLCKNKSLVSNPKKSKTLVPVLFFLISSILFINYVQSIDSVHASPSLAQSIQQFQKNLQSTINKEIQSIDEIGNNTNCSNNISIQTQSNNNGQISSTTENSCKNGSIFSSTSFGQPINDNLSGLITSAGFNLQNGKIISSIYGNWSLLHSKNDGKIDFMASVIKQPFSLDLYNQSSNANSQSNKTVNVPNATSSSVISKPLGNNIESSLQTNSTANQKQIGKSSPLKQSSVPGSSESIKLSNLRVTTTMQQNDDVTYKGTIDVNEKKISNDPNVSTVVNAYKNTGVSLSILDGRILVINFDKQTNLFQEFRDIPLVGLVVN